MQGKQPQINMLPSETEGKYPDDNPPQNRDKMMSNPLLDMDRFEILGADKKDKRTFYLKDDIPIKIAILDNQFFISYEARIPLYPSENFKYAINPGKNKTISLGFEFGEIESRKTRSGNRSFGEPGQGVLHPMEVDLAIQEHPQMVVVLVDPEVVVLAEAEQEVTNHPQILQNLKI